MCSEFYSGYQHFPVRVPSRRIKEIQARVPKVGNRWYILRFEDLKVCFSDLDWTFIPKAISLYLSYFWRLHFLILVGKSKKNDSDLKSSVIQDRLVQILCTKTSINRVHLVLDLLVNAETIISFVPPCKAYYVHKSVKWYNPFPQLFFMTFGPLNLSCWIDKTFSFNPVSLRVTRNSQMLLILLRKFQWKKKYSGVNFTNILHAAFTYVSCACNFFELTL